MNVTIAKLRATKFIIALASTLVLASLGCGFDSNKDNTNSTTSASPIATRMQLISGSKQFTDGRRVFQHPLVVRVLDHNGNGAPGRVVSWRVARGEAELLGPANTSTIDSGDTRQELRALGPGEIEVEAAIDGLSGSPVRFTAQAHPALEAAITMERFVRGRKEVLSDGKTVTCADVPISVSVEGGSPDTEIEWLGGQMAFSGANVVNYFREDALDAAGAAEFWGQAKLSSGQTASTVHTFSASSPFLVLIRFDYKVPYSSQKRSVSFNAFNCTD